MTRERSVYQPVLERVLTHAAAHLESLQDAPVSALVTKEQLRSRLARSLPARGTDPAHVIDDLVADTAGGLLGSPSGRFFGWVIGGSLPAALAADWLTSTWDQNAALYACGPAVAVIEEICGRWLKQLLGIPEKASFALVTGCQMSHVTCLAAARHHLLEAGGWDVETKGLWGAPRICLLTGTHRHGSIERAVRLLGLGRECIVDLPLDDQSRLSSLSLEKALKEREGDPNIVVLQAGDINTGSFDPFRELISLAHEHHAWVHVDGAFGLWANASPKLRHFLNGAEAADSWSTDGHKWLNVPYDCGYAFVANANAHRDSLSLRASYLTHGGVTGSSRSPASRPASKFAGRGIEGEGVLTPRRKGAEAQRNSEGGFVSAESENGRLRSRSATGQAGSTKRSLALRAGVRVSESHAAHAIALSAEREDYFGRGAGMLPDALC